MSALRRLPAALLLAVAMLAAAPPPPYTYQRAGRAQDVGRPTRAGFALIGGGTDLDSAFQWLCQRSGGGDFLVLRASGTDAYNSYIQKLCPAENSIATLVLPSRAAAETPFARQAIEHAEAIFISGGDQSQYVNFWTGTPVQRAINAAIRRGVPVGGTSAGLAVLGEFGYSAQNDLPNGPNLTSPGALADPYQHQVVWVRNFLAIAPLRGLITDTHFHARNRLGRLLVFMARILQSGQARTIHGLGVDQHTAVLVDADGAAVVAGSGAAYFFFAADPPTVCRPGQPLSFGRVAVERLRAGQHINLARWQSAHGVRYTLTVSAGRIRSSQPGGAIY
ncbi:MAG: cyanophycinase [Terriglobales bacterium]